MRTLVVAAGMVAVAGAAHAQTPQQPSEVLLGLGEYCWEAQLPDVVTDTHCFSVARGGHLVMDVHKVRARSGGVVYEGVTLYRMEEATGAVRFDYYNSGGQLVSGYARREGSRVVFSDKAGGAPTTVWSVGPDAYEAGTGNAKAAKQRFAKVGQALEGGF